MKKLIYKPGGRAADYADLALNVYLQCPYACVYCYGPSAVHKSRKLFFRDPSPRDKFAVILGADCKRLSKRQPVPQVFLSFVADPYPPGETHMQMTRQALRTLSYWDINFRVLTKNPLLGIRDLDLYGQGDSFGTTLTFEDEKSSKQWEPGAATPKERLLALEIMHDRGIDTWASIEPIISEVHTLDVVTASLPHVNEYRIGKLNHAKPPKPIDWPAFLSVLIDRIGPTKKIVVKRELQEYVPERCRGQVARPPTPDEEKKGGDAIEETCPE